MSHLWTLSLLFFAIGYQINIPVSSRIVGRTLAFRSLNVGITHRRFCDLCYICVPVLRFVLTCQGFSMRAAHIENVQKERRAGTGSEEEESWRARASTQQGQQKWRLVGWQRVPCKNSTWASPITCYLRNTLHLYPTFSKVLKAAYIAVSHLFFAKCCQLCATICRGKKSSWKHKELQMIWGPSCQREMLIFNQTRGISLFLSLSLKSPCISPRK